MTVSATDRRISSPDTHHVAIRTTNTAWSVTYLRRDHRLTRTQAMNAMELAAVVGSSPGHIDQSDPIYRLVAKWAAELGVDVDDAITAAERGRRWTEEV